MKKCIIYGTGDFSDVLFEKLLGSNKDVIGYTLDKEYVNASTYNNKPVYAYEELCKVFRKEEIEIYVGVIGKNMFESRERLIRKIEADGYYLPNYISERASVFTKEIGIANIIMENVVIEGHCEIGDGNIIWPNVVMPHHNKVGSFNNISPSASFSGYSKVGNRCFIGNNACLNNRVTVNDCALVGAGVFVAKDLEAEKVLVSQRSYILEGRKSYEFK